jgi:pyruvate/2-oxoglutarate dehydrogenase complex dihydrolipoamide dehydrogenase (E3) component
MNTRDFDVLVIGTGQAGVPLATRLAGNGRTVAVFEREAVGGTCVNTGCTPTKTMVASARAAHVARTAARLGVQVDGVRIDFPAVIARKNDMVMQWRGAVQRRLDDAGDRLALVRGHAAFVAERTIEVEGRRYAADTVIIDTGARAVVPSLPGLDGVPWLDNRRIMELDRLPDHLLVLGGGYIGCEFGQMFRRFGAAVTIVDPNAHLLGREDVELSEALERVFRAEGVVLRLGEAASGVAGEDGRIALALSSGEEVCGTHLLVAVGRRPNTDDLACEAAGIALDERGAIRIDDRFRTTAQGVYAVGDVTGGPQFTHASWDDHRILLDILEGRDRDNAGRVVPYVVFTDPQVARVGLSEREAAASGIVFEKAEFPFGAIARAIEVDETAGVIKVLVDPATERILGAALVGLDAGELIHVFVALMNAGAPAGSLVRAQIVHPTLAEGLQSALMQLERYAP